MRRHAVPIVCALVIAAVALAYCFRPPLASGLITAGQRQRQAGDFDGAFATLTRAIETDPKLAQAWHSRGVVCIAKEDWAGAARDFGKAVELGNYPERAVGLTCRGQAKEHLGDIEGARLDHGAALALDPNCVPAYINRGFVRDGAGEWAEAAKDFTRVIELHPEIHEGWFYRGVVRLKQGDQVGAATDFEKAIRIKPALKEMLLAKYGWPRAATDGIRQQ